ncbi:thioredoxin domain-containing protein [Bacillus luteus]|uniref:Thioredoxin domain-containing protein n=1 Tax=Alkalicoccus luteus TaxID=1237094 RepID=A0A969PQ43_9BACI|nr:thioredoxin domain-containing protein [Alkalicoccus luteus]
MEGKDVDIEWLPFELRPYPQETLSPHSDYIQQAWHQRILPIADQLGVTMNLNMTDPQPHTHLAHEGLLFAKEQDLGNAYAHRLFKAFYEEGLDIGDLSVLERLAEETGLESAAFRTALEERRYSADREASQQRAYEEGVQAVPTFFIGGQKLTGLQGQQAYEQALADEMD